ncbi:MAG: hypothetical protein ACRDDY_01970 [Clostridium sp.]|uniref:hypothetical protein n=1 Tax=Clostridium sp. TaxID=1506 RepID=UPI003EE5DF6A
MGYYRGEYEEYYRSIKMGTGRSSYNRRGTYNNRDYSDIRGNRESYHRRSKVKGINEHIYDFLKIIGLQMVAVGSVGILVYVCGITKEKEFRELNKTVIEVLKTDYYFNENQFIDEVKLKIFKEK